MKVVLIILGAVFGIVLLFILAVIGHIFWGYYRIVCDRIDEYFYQREIEKEQKEIYEFKKKL